MNHIDANNLEKSTYDWFAVWLTQYFDGGSHAIGTSPAVQFPQVSISFAQSQLPQPVSGDKGASTAAAAVGITMVWAQGPAPSLRMEAVNGLRQQVAYQKVRWNFWIRSDTADNHGRALVMQAGSRLQALLQNAAATLPLAQQGVRRLRPESPVPIADNTYILRMLCCQATLKYVVMIN